MNLLPEKTQDNLNQAFEVLDRMEESFETLLDLIEDLENAGIFQDKKIGEHLLRAQNLVLDARNLALYVEECATLGEPDFDDLDD